MTPQIENVTPAGGKRRSISLVDSLCSHEDPVVAYRARRLLAGESERSPAIRRLRRSIATTKMAQRLLMGLHMERLNPYRKWQGPPMLDELFERGEGSGNPERRPEASAGPSGSQ